MHFFVSPGLALSLGAIKVGSARAVAIIAIIFIGVPSWIAIWVLLKQRFRR